MDTEYRIKNKIRQVKNEKCAASSCNKLATKEILFEFGFSARFCDICSENLLAKKIGRVKDTCSDL